jgi:hypothetical protein
MKGTLLVGMALACVPLSVGCGHDAGGTSATGGGAGGSGATCSSNASCGGDIVGTWALTQACNPRVSVPITCAGDQYTASGVAQTGTFVFRADGTATQMVRTTGTLLATMPPACLAQRGMTCAEMEATLRTGPNYTSAICIDKAGTCECTLAFDASTNVSGTYTTSGSTLTANGGSSTATYCVTGASLVMRPDGQPAGEPTLTFVLTRQ